MNLLHIRQYTHRQSQICGRDDGIVVLDDDVGAVSRRRVPLDVALHVVVGEGDGELQGVAHVLDTFVGRTCKQRKKII